MMKNVSCMDQSSIIMHASDNTMKIIDKKEKIAFFIMN